MNEMDKKSIEQIYKFRSVLPEVQKWIDNLLEEYQENAVFIIDLGFLKLKNIFPLDLLKKSKSVIITGKLPFPPLSNMGLSGFEKMENMILSGITYKDTFFVNYKHKTDGSLYFHEMVHIVQWNRLGEENFLLAYGIGIMQYGYYDCPLEKMAFSLKEKFDHGTLEENFIEMIKQETDKIWSSLVSLFSNL